MKKKRGGTMREEQSWANWSTYCEVVIQKIKGVQWEKKRVVLTDPSTAFFSSN